MGFFDSLKANFAESIARSATNGANAVERKGGDRLTQEHKDKVSEARYLAQVSGEYAKNQTKKGDQ